MTALPPDVLVEIATTRPGTRSAASLTAALHARRLLLLKALLVKTDQRRVRVSSTARAAFEWSWEALERAERTDPAAVREVLDYPTTGAWLTEALTAAGVPAFERHLSHLGGVAVAAATRAGCAVHGTLPLPARALVLPGIGLLHCPSGRARVEGHHGTVRVTDDVTGEGVALRPPETDRGPCRWRHVQGGEGWSALRSLPGGLVVLDDLDPYRAPSRGIGPSALPASERAAFARRPWAERWYEAHAFLSATDPARAAEVGTVLRAVVPLARPQPAGAVPVSATLEAAPGAVLTQLPADAVEFGEVLVHEVQHSKLAVLNGVLPLCRPGRGALHRVGWRPDPRPLPAVLQGVYAHLALADLAWRALSAPGTVRRRGDGGRHFETYRDQVAEALSILRGSDELTTAGSEFVKHMARYHAGLGMADHGLRQW